MAALCIPVGGAAYRRGMASLGVVFQPAFPPERMLDYARAVEAAVSRRFGDDDTGGDDQGATT